MNAILIEDEEIMQRCFIRMSEGIEGFQLDGVFGNADDAMQFAAEHIFDIAFVDILLPGTDGIALAEMLRKSRPEVQIVLVSAVEEKFDDYDVLKEVPYLTKPYTREQLIEVIDSLRK